MRRLSAVGVVVMLLTVPTVWLARVAAGQETRPGIEIVAPRNQAEVRGPNVAVQMRVRGVELASRRSRAGAYILLRLDDAPPVKSFSDQFTFQGVAAGNHILRAELRRNDGSAFEPPARAQVRFSVQASAR